MSWAAATVLRGGSRALRRVSPTQASLMGMALSADLQTEPLPAQPLRDLGLEPRAVGTTSTSCSAPVET